MRANRLSFRESGTVFRGTTLRVFRLFYMTEKAKVRWKLLGCRTALCNSGQIRLLGAGQIAEVTTGCPIALEQRQQIPFLPQHRADQREEARETVAPIRKKTQVTQQEVNQQRRPDLPPAPIQFHDALGAPLQVVAQENHFDFLAVDLHQRHDPAEQFREVLARSRSGETNQIVAKNFAHGPALIAAHDLEAQIVLGPRHPKDHAPAQVGQMSEVDVSLVEYDDFARLDPGAQLPGAFGVVMPGGVHDGETRQETLQVQAQMALGGVLAPTMSRPIHAGSDQREGGRVHEVNGPFEFSGKAVAGFAADKTRREFSQVLEHGPEE